MVWGCFSGIGLGPLHPVKGSLNTSAYKDIFENAMLPTFWEEFVEGPFLFQPVCDPVHISVSLVWKNLTGLHRALCSTPSNTSGINQNKYCETGFFIQLQSLSSNALLNKQMGKNFQRNTLKSCRKPSQKSGSCFRFKVGTNPILMCLECNVIKSPVGVMVTCHNTFYIQRIFFKGISINSIISLFSHS